MSPHPFETTIKPRVCETDMMGHINNTTLAIWYEVARAEMASECRAACPDVTGLLMVVRVEMDYLGELFHGSEVTIRSGLDRIGNSSLSIAHETWQNGKLCGRGRSVLAYVDRSSRRPTPVPQQARDYLARFALPA